MLDIRFVRKNPDAVRSDLKKRGDKQKLNWFDELLELDEQQRALQQQADNLRADRNKTTEKVKLLKKQGLDATHALKEAQEIPEKIRRKDEEREKTAEKVRHYLMRLPNLLHESVPIGKDDSENETIREWGGKAIPCDEPKSHVDLLQSLELADLERAARISGARFYFLKNELVLLDYALQRLALDTLYKKGFTLLEPPHLMSRKPYEGATDLSDFENVMYKIEGEDAYLIATSEHPVVAMHAGEILDELPLKYAGVSPCYRKEAGAHGKDTKGIFRVHHFNKVEQVVFCKPEDSWKLHEELLANAEDFFKKLEIPFRVVNICTGDIGTVAAKKYDIEAWMPAQGTYREVVSASNCTAYQACRLGIRYRTGAKNNKGEDEKDWVHTLNSTMVATSRAMVAILENHQNQDGSITIPKALQPYLPGIKKIRPKR
ncbi:TPA: serine--tRNA ligase [Candidatus Micrarchaeota archaeon]|nr:MAG: serine--tRNA ligase [Candidatus Micrarchaeota archaeon CG1_02_51_15]HII38531.1 serine--tRNA ligase [Candidatus Micrarchaeota archaeon]